MPELDDLTGLMWRRDFIIRAQKMVGEARCESAPLAVALLHIDDFANLSVMHNLFTAEETVSTLGKLIHSRLRAKDLRGRCCGAIAYAV